MKADGHEHDDVAGAPDAPSGPGLPPPTTPERTAAEPSEPAPADVPTLPESRGSVPNGAALLAAGKADGEFVPLRTDPPPNLLSTWWLRYLLLLLMILAIATSLLVERASSPGDVVSSAPVIGLHLSAAALLVVWSDRAMRNAALLVPPTRYRQAARGWVATVLWLVALCAPVVAGAVVSSLRRRAEDPVNDGGVLTATVVIALLAAVVVYLPFRYHARHAQRIGAPHSVFLQWFWLPLLAAVACIGALALGLDQMLAEDGWTAGDRVARVAVGYGAPVLLFALSTWRAVTVFDEVIDIRWRRWRTEWEQTLADMSAQPPPGPEPVVPGR